MAKRKRKSLLGPSATIAVNDALVPRQERSKRRADAIVKVARALIAKHGVLGLKMSEIAANARLPIGSIYQYFPTRSALIAHLFARNLETYHELGRKCLGEVTSATDCVAAIRRLLLEVYRDNKRDILMREIWSGVRADRAIRQLHLADSEFFAQLFFSAIKRVGSDQPDEKLYQRCRIVNEMWDGTIRLAITMDKRDGEALLEESLLLGLSDLGLLSRS